MKKVTELDKVEIEKELMGQLYQCLSTYNAEGGKKEVIEIDQINQTITIKFGYVIVEEDNFIGFSGY